MNINWTKADSWYRRDTEDGCHLTVSRTRSGSWSWRWNASGTGRVLGKGDNHDSHLGAMIEADQTCVPVFEAVA